MRKKSAESISDPTRREYHRKYREEHREEINARKRRYSSEHPEKIRKWMQTYRAKLRAKKQAGKDQAGGNGDD